MSTEIRVLHPSHFEVDPVIWTESGQSQVRIPPFLPVVPLFPVNTSSHQVPLPQLSVCEISQ